MPPKTHSRIYLVTDGDSGEKYLVKALSAAQAVRHVTKPFTAQVATQTHLVTLLEQGVPVEDATKASVQP